MTWLNIHNLLDIFRDWLLALQELWVTMNTSIGYLLEPLIIQFPPFAAVGVALQVLGLYDFTLLEFMLSAGLFIYIVYQLITWILNLVT